MGWSSDLATGLAAHLDAGGVGTYEPSGAYDPAMADPAITFQSLPDLPGGKAIALSFFFPNGGTGGVTAVAQLHFRGDEDPLSPDEIADAAWTLLDNAEHLTLGGIHVALMYRQTSAPLGLDDSGRWTRADTYHLIADRPSTNWPD